MPVLYIRVTPALRRRVRDEAVARAKRLGGTPRQGDTARDLIAERLWQLDGADQPRNSLSVVASRARARKKK